MITKRTLLTAIMTGLVFVLVVSQTAVAYQPQEKPFVDAVRDVQPVSAAFTYQGELKDISGRVTGVYDFDLTLYSAQRGGEKLHSISYKEVVLTNGWFTLEVDFGRAVDGRWLEIAVRPAGSLEQSDVLAPRQKLTVVPSAVFARHEQWSLVGMPVGVSDVADVEREANVISPNDEAPSAKVPGEQEARSGTIEPVNDPGDTGNADVPSASQEPTLWSIFGNYGTDSNRHFLGTGDEQDLAIRTSNSERMRINRSGQVRFGVGYFHPNALLTVHGPEARAGIFSRSDLGDGIIGEAMVPGKSGVYGFNAMGPGISGRSESSPGVVGWTSGEDQSGVLGHSQNRVGVRGQSDGNDGVVGWTGHGARSGVFGHSQAGIGVSGRSDGNDGLLGVTTSRLAGHAGLRARNEGGGPAIFCEGDLFITGAIRGDLGPAGGASFPRPAYDSGWVPISQVGTPVGLDATITLEHNVGGNPDNYVVDLQFRDTQLGIHHWFYGGYRIGAALREDTTSNGGWYSNLTSQNIAVWRGWSDRDVEQVRVRIWVYR